MTTGTKVTDEWVRGRLASIARVRGVVGRVAAGADDLEVLGMVAAFEAQGADAVLAAEAVAELFDRETAALEELASLRLASRRPATRRRVGNGLFLVFAGADGCGKDLQAARLVERLETSGYCVAVSAEPSREGVGAFIRAMIRDGVAADPVEMALLFAADRARHVREVVAPNLNAGAVVVSTRHYESSLAYQGLDLELAGVCGGMDWVREINARFCAPDLTIVLDVPTDELVRRLGRRADPDAYERDVARVARTSAFYARLEDHLPWERVAHVDGAAAVEAVRGAIWDAVAPVLPGHETATASPA